MTRVGTHYTHVLVGEFRNLEIIMERDHFNLSFVEKLAIVDSLFWIECGWQELGIKLFIQKHPNKARLVQRIRGLLTIFFRWSLGSNPAEL